MTCIANSKHVCREYQFIFGVTTLWLYNRTSPLSRIVLHDSGCTCLGVEEWIFEQSDAWRPRWSV